MARLIQKSGYIQGGRAARYMEYVAKRDGVEVLQSTEPVTKKQMQFLTKLLKDFPDAKELFEYADYLQTPNRGTASAFIVAALDTHLHELESESGYMAYIANRPRAEKRGGHGLFSAGRSRGLTMVPIIQALAQLEKNYGREGAEILTDNCQDTIFGGFAPNSQTAEQLSKALGSRTVLSGSVSRSKNDPSQSLQMMERPLMTPDELKSIPKGSFVVMKTGTHPMQTKLRLFLDWGITFGEPYITPEHAARPVAYASRQELFLRIDRAYGKKGTQPTQVQQAPVAERRSPYSAMGLYNEDAKT